MLETRAPDSSEPDIQSDELAVLDSIQRRVLWLATAIVHHANNVRPNPDHTKVGGHQASSASIVSILTALYFKYLRAGDRVAIKPHASPAYHAVQYLLGNLPRDYLTRLRAFGGLQAYHGRAQHMRTMEERHGVIEAASQHVQHTKRLLKEAGIACPIVTGAGSGTFMFEVESGAWDEIQCGSYAFMDVDYARNEWAAPLPRFEHALFVYATVMSRPSEQMAIVDAGLKASSVDSGMPGVWQKELRYTHASDEHGWVEGKTPPALGEFALPHDAE